VVNSPRVPGRESEALLMNMSTWLEKWSERAEAISWAQVGERMEAGRAIIF